MVGYAEIYDAYGRLTGFGTAHNWTITNVDLFQEAWRDSEDHRQALEQWETDGGPPAVQWWGMPAGGWRVPFSWR